MHSATESARGSHAFESAQSCRHGGAPPVSAEVQHALMHSLLHTPSASVHMSAMANALTTTTNSRRVSTRETVQWAGRIRD